MKPSAVPSPGRRCALLCLLSLLLPAWVLTARAAQRDLLIHWNLDEGRGAVAKDRSGNGLDGAVRAAWTNSPAGSALTFNGTSSAIVSLDLPGEQRLGRGSWTFMAWVRPTRLAIDDPQNQRRLFTCGVYPDAYVVIDITGQGRVVPYLCYRPAGGRVVSAGATAVHALVEGAWAHVAVVCDREARRLTVYVNGVTSVVGDLPAEFDGDFSVSGRLTLGSGWHNIVGAVDEFRLHRAALTAGAVREEFERRRGAFQPPMSRELAAAANREAFAATVRDIDSAWAARRFGRVRTGCDEILEADAPPQLHSYIRLRRARSFLAEGKPAAARADLEQVRTNAAFPDVHRFEAEETLREIGRALEGQPPRDPAASRTPMDPVTGFAAEVFVDALGSDLNDGSMARPFNTLARARDEVRRLRSRNVTGPLAVTVRPGRYRVREAIEFGRQDSGAAGAPVVYRGTGPGRPVFHGGARLGGFVPVTDAAVLARLPEESRGRVWQCDLRSRGITNFGELRVRGFAQPPSPPTVEVFFNGRPLTLARWPNEGFVGIQRLVDGGFKAAGRPSVFEYVDDRHARWTAAPDAWLFGYFRYLWADATIRVGKIDPARRTVTTAEAYDYGGGMTTEQGIAYYAFNLLEEIDRPGEWYLDRGTGLLYLLPPADPATATIEIGLLATPMMVLKGVSNLRLEGLDFDLGRYHGLILEDCTNAVIAGCTVTRLAGNGISVLGGRSNTLFGCDLSLIGRRATEVIGGDRATLEPGGHLVENCRIHDFGRIDRTYTPAIQLEGVGNRVAHNLLYDAPSSVMRIEGNDHLIEFNDVHSAVRESDDQGAMELFGNPTYRGVVFRHNRFRNIGKTGTEAAVHGQAAIRFDDAISGMTVYGNIFIRAANGHFGAIQMNSGRDNVIDNNLFIDCRQGISGGWFASNSVWNRVRRGERPAGFYLDELHTRRYPRLAHLLDDPALNFVWRNVFFRCGPETTGNRAHLDLMENGSFPEADPGFENAAAGDYRLREDAALFATVAFKPVPVDEIGLYEHPYRASWPVDTTPVPLRDWRETR